MLKHLLTLTLIPLCLFTCQKKETNAGEKYIIAYFFPGDRIITEDEIAVEKLTHINYAFANIEDGMIIEGFKYDSVNFKILNLTRKRNPDLKLLISVGGWTWSGRFSDMALTAKSRQRFIDSSIRFIKKHALDGIDLDWEYPNLVGYGNIFRPEDTHNFTLLLKEFRLALDVLGKEQNRHLMLTIAAGAFDDYLSNTEMGMASPYLDLVNLMAYDQYEAEGDTIAGHHAPLFTNPRDPKNNSADASLRKFVQAGVPVEKMVLGVAFYGRAWEVRQADYHGLYEAAGPVKRRVDTSFNNLKGELENRNGFTRYWDPAAKAPYLFSEAEKIFISYDDEESLQEKCRYIRQNHLAGVMFWEYQDDYRLQLVQTLYDNLQ